MAGANRWRTAAVFGTRPQVDDLLIALATVSRCRGVPLPIDKAWDPIGDTALWLYGVASVAVDGAPWGWTVLRPVGEGTRPLRALADRVDIACAIPTAPITGEQGGMDSRVWTVAALDRERVVWDTPGTT